MNDLKLTKKKKARPRSKSDGPKTPFIGPLWKNGKEWGSRYQKKDPKDRKPPPPRDPNTGRFVPKGSKIPEKIIKPPSPKRIKKPKSEKIRVTRPKPSTEAAKKNFKIP